MKIINYYDFFFLVPPLSVSDVPPSTDLTVPSSSTPTVPSSSTPTVPSSSTPTVPSSALTVGGGGYTPLPYINASCVFEFL
nr:protein PRRC2C-like isoform X3 [Hydra vulgaris]